MLLGLGYVLNLIGRPSTWAKDCRVEERQIRSGLTGHQLLFPMSLKSSWSYSKVEDKLEMPVLLS